MPAKVGIQTFCRISETFTDHYPLWVSLRQRRRPLRVQTDSPKTGSGRNVECLQIRAAEGAIGDRVLAGWNEAERLALGREDIDPAFDRAVLLWRKAAVQPRGDIRVPIAVKTHAVATSPRSKVVEHPPSADGAIRQQSISVHLSSTAQARVVVHNIESLLVRRNRNPVGAFHVRDDAHEFAGRVDSIHGFLVQFQTIAIPVARICEIDPSLGIYRQIIRAIQTLSFVLFSQNRESAIAIRAGDSTRASFARQ